MQLVVNDGQLNSPPDTVTINTANSAPIANAGPNQTTVLGRTVQLNGSGSTDIDGQALTFIWSILTAPAGSTAALSNPSAVAPTITIDKAWDLCPPTHRERRTIVLASRHRNDYDAE